MESANITQIVKNNPVVSFFILAFLIGLVIAVPLILSIYGIISVELPGFLYLIAASSSTYRNIGRAT